MPTLTTASGEEEAEHWLTLYGTSGILEKAISPLGIPCITQITTASNNTVIKLVNSNHFPRGN